MEISERKDAALQGRTRRLGRDASTITTLDGDALSLAAHPPKLSVKLLKADLKRQSTKLVALDSGEGAAAQLVLAMAADQTLMQAVHAFGFHGGPTKAGGASWLPGWGMSSLSSSESWLPSWAMVSSRSGSTAPSSIPP